MTREELAERYGSDTGDRVWERIEFNTRGKLHATHIRVCEVGNLVEEQAYEKIKEEGCCGEFELDYAYGERQFRIGFNYGH